MIDPTLLDELFDAMARYVRLRDRAVHTTFRTADGDVEVAAYKGLFHLIARPMRSRELADALNSDPSTASRHVAQLVGQGLVRREADPDDGRATLLVITTAGRTKVEAMREGRRQAFSTAMADWNSADLGDLVTLLNRFVDSVEQVVNPHCAPKPDGPESSGADTSTHVRLASDSARKGLHG